MPTVTEVLQDSEFTALPTEERRKVLSAIDTDFSALPGSEQDKVLGVTSKPQDFRLLMASPDFQKGALEPYKGAAKALGEDVINTLKTAGPLGMLAGAVSDASGLSKKAEEKLSRNTPGEKAGAAVETAATLAPMAESVPGLVRAAADKAGPVTAGVRGALPKLPGGGRIAQLPAKVKAAYTAAKESAEAAKATQEAASRFDAMTAGKSTSAPVAASTPSRTTSTGRLLTPDEIAFENAPKVAGTPPEPYTPPEPEVKPARVPIRVEPQQQVPPLVEPIPPPAGYVRRAPINLPFPEAPAKPARAPGWKGLPPTEEVAPAPVSVASESKLPSGRTPGSIANQKPSSGKFVPTDEQLNLVAQGQGFKKPFRTLAPQDQENITKTATNLFGPKTSPRPEPIVKDGIIYDEQGMPVMKMGTEPKGEGAAPLPDKATTGPAKAPETKTSRTNRATPEQQSFSDRKATTNRHITAYELASKAVADGVTPKDVINLSPDELAEFKKRIGMGKRSEETWRTFVDHLYELSRRKK